MKAALLRKAVDGEPWKQAGLTYRGACCWYALVLIIGFAFSVRLRAQAELS
jgi:hypothetical protein